MSSTFYLVFMTACKTSCFYHETVTYGQIIYKINDNQACNEVMEQELTWNETKQH